MMRRKISRLVTVAEARRVANNRRELGLAFAAIVIGTALSWVALYLINRAHVDTPQPRVETPVRWEIRDA